jgi:hypothetical protein
MADIKRTAKRLVCAIPQEILHAGQTQVPVP